MMADWNLYKGIASPLTFDANGNIIKASDVTLLRSALKTLFRLKRGEKFMDPSRGSDVRKFLFSPNDPVTQESIAAAIQAAVDRFEPRIQIDSVRPNPSNEDIEEHKLPVTIYFRFSDLVGEAGKTLFQLDEEIS